MSVLIKDMEMPKACWECQLKVYLFQQLWCVPSNKVIDRGDNTKREPDCPLIEIPTPHGNLIDSDALLSDDEIVQILTGNPQRTGKLIKEFAEMFVNKVNRQPTIIEAEGSKNENNNV